MPALTLLESAKYSSDVKRKGMIKIITERSPILQYLPMIRIKGNAYQYKVETALPGIAFRAVGDTYPSSTHVINPVVERLSIWGGEVKIDNFQINTQGNEMDLKAAAYAAKGRAMAMFFNEKFWEADSTSNLLEFDGLRVRITGSMLKTAGVNGAALTLDMLDELIDSPVGMGDGAHAFLNKTLRRKITKLGRDVSGGTLLDRGNDAFGKQVQQYNGVPLCILEREDNEATILDFDETTGSSNVTASIYVVRFGKDYVFGIEGEGGSMEVKDFGELQSAPQHMGRIEAYHGLGVAHPRAAARLRGILNS